MNVTAACCKCAIKRRPLAFVNLVAFTTERTFRVGALELILLIVIVLLLFGAIPAWPHSRRWGYGPSGGLGLLLIVLLLLVLFDVF
jgi:hypothetical protein